MPLDTDGDGALTPAEIETSDWASTFPWFDVDGDGKAALTEIARQLEIMGSKDFGLVAIDLAAAGGPRILWRERKTLPYVATPIVHQGVLFLVKDGGILTSYDPRTGAILKRAGSGARPSRSFCRSTPAPLVDRASLAHAEGDVPRAAQRWGNRAGIWSNDW